MVKDKLLGGTASSGLGDAILGEVLLMCVVQPQSPAERLWRINWDVLIFLRCSEVSPESPPVQPGCRAQGLQPWSIFVASALTSAGDAQGSQTLHPHWELTLKNVLAS